MKPSILTLAFVLFLVGVAHAQWQHWTDSDRTPVRTGETHPLPVTGGYAVISALFDISEDTNTSIEVDLAGHSLVGLYLPGTFDGTTLTFYCSPTSGGTYLQVYDDANAAVSATVAASRYIGLKTSALNLAACRFLKLESGTVQSTTDTAVLVIAK